eukprot:GHVL01015460.1.p1 GENE.GHVL01015460.1~~GHVL01015460.1.p1  ORF type:complete len:401 (-),score=109.23 GHVL01015460.1:114-1214(-)
MRQEIDTFALSQLEKKRKRSIDYRSSGDVSPRDKTKKRYQKSQDRKDKQRRADSKQRSRRRSKITPKRHSLSRSPRRSQSSRRDRRRDSRDSVRRDRRRESSSYRRWASRSPAKRHRSITPPLFSEDLRSDEDRGGGRRGSRRVQGRRRAGGPPTGDFEKQPPLSDDWDDAYIDDSGRAGGDSYLRQSNEREDPSTEATRRRCSASPLDWKPHIAPLNLSREDRAFESMLKEEAEPKDEHVRLLFQGQLIDTCLLSREAVEHITSIVPTATLYKEDMSDTDMSDTDISVSDISDTDISDTYISDTYILDTYDDLKNIDNIKNDIYNKLKINDKKYIINNIVHANMTQIIKISNSELSDENIKQEFI